MSHPLPNAPTRLIDMRPIDQKLVNACYDRRPGDMIEAVREGADLQSYYLPMASGTTAFHAGLMPLHVAVKMGFSEGVCKLIQLGTPPDVAEKKHPYNPPLMLSQGQSLAFACLLAMGADPTVKNGLNHSLSQKMQHFNQQRLPADKNPSQEMGLLQLFHAIPKRPERDYSGLTREELFHQNSRGLCLLDNPLTLRDLDKVARALAANGTPLRPEDLQRTVPRQAAIFSPKYMPAMRKLLGTFRPITVMEKLQFETEKTTTNYWQRVIETGNLEKAVEALNHQNIRVGKTELLDGGLLVMAAENLQLQSVFTKTNWAGAPLRDLQACYSAIPAEHRWQIRNYAQLKQVTSHSAMPGRSR